MGRRFIGEPDVRASLLTTVRRNTMNRFMQGCFLSDFGCRGRARKVIAGATAFLFSYAVLAAPVAEANFWNERRQAVRQAQETVVASAPAARPQFARLPGSLDFNQAL